jgi:hypothetical protein
VNWKFKLNWEIPVGPPEPLSEVPEHLRQLEATAQTLLISESSMFAIGSCFWISILELIGNEESEANSLPLPLNHSSYRMWIRNWLFACCLFSLVVSDSSPSTPYQEHSNVSSYSSPNVQRPSKPQPQPKSTSSSTQQTRQLSSSAAYDDYDHNSNTNTYTETEHNADKHTGEMDSDSW